MLKVLALFLLFKQILWNWKIDFSVELWINFVRSFQCFYNVFLSMFLQCVFDDISWIFFGNLYFAPICIFFSSQQKIFTNSFQNRSFIFCLPFCWRLKLQTFFLQLLNFLLLTFLSLFQQFVSLKWSATFLCFVIHIIQEFIQTMIQVLSKS